MKLESEILQDPEDINWLMEQIADKCDFELLFSSTRDGMSGNLYSNNKITIHCK